MLAPRKAHGKAIKQEMQPDIDEGVTNTGLVPKDVASAPSNGTLDLKKDDENYESVKKIPPKGRKAPSMNTKAIKAREKALGEKFAEVTSKLDSVLEKGDGVVVDCFYHAPSKLATVGISSYARLMIK